MNSKEKKYIPPGRRTQENVVQRNPEFGFTRLKSFLTIESDNVILYVHQDITQWKEFIGSDRMTQNLLVMTIDVLAEKLCQQTMLTEQQAKILSICCSSTAFVNKLRNLADDIDSSCWNPNSFGRNVAVDCSAVKVLSNLYTFCSFVLHTMPAAALDYLKRLVGSAYLASQNETVNQISDELTTNFGALRAKLEELSRANKAKHESKQRVPIQFRFADSSTNSHEEDPPNHIRDIDVIPTIEELLDPSDVFLRQNKKFGSYKDSEHYLDVQFRLFREDFVRPLRNGIQNFLDHKTEYLQKGRMPIGELRLYTDVKFIKVVKDRDSIVHKFQLAKHNYTKHGKPIKWNKSKRLLPGSLILLTIENHCFEPLYTHFGIVFNRNYSELEQGILTVTWESASPFLDESQEYLMFESEVYLESRRYTLEILKELQLDTFTMKKFIVDADVDMNAPKYLQNATRTTQVTLKNGRTTHVAPLSKHGWPTAEEFGLDENQFEAFRAALTKEFTIIQGPPGTGKTFLGLKVADVLLKNAHLWRSQRANPITVVCYTNHALDQFLEGIVDLYAKMDSPVDILRIGGNSKSELMANFSLAKVRQRKIKKRPRNYPAEERKARDRVYEQEKVRSELVVELSELRDVTGIVDFQKTSVWTEIQPKCPFLMYRYLQNQAWFGLSDENLNSVTDAKEQIRTWFLILEALKKTAKPAEDDVINPSSRGANKDENSEEEEEDMDELLENRVFDDMPVTPGLPAEDFHENRRQRQIMKNRLYLPTFSVSNIENDIDRMETNLDRMQSVRSEQKLVMRRNIKNMRLRMSILQSIFQFYNEKRLILPDVKNELASLMQHSVTWQNISVAKRWAIYFETLKFAQEKLSEKVANSEKELMKIKKEHRAIIDWGDSFILQDCQVVGLTTTGAAKYNNLLKGMKSKIVIVEEAAQVFEAQVVTCITECCEQLIMIGDHLQLRPSPTVYELGTKYNLDLSLFERMVNNNLHCYQLKMQHRMQPNIANLIVGPIYKALLNHPSVTTYPDVSGLAKNVFFVTHNYAESSETDSKSKFNKFEETFITGLCRYLVLQGYKPQQITVLTMYTGQMFNLRSSLRKLDSCQGVRVTNVDNFQGEENDIILLSLVRSNTEGVIGFLNIDNRVNVALSRARHGLYIVGNLGCMVVKSKTWQTICSKLAAKDMVGNMLELKCQTHGNVTKVRYGSEFYERCPEGGCLQQCNVELPCKHKCTQTCHAANREPEQHICQKTCSKLCDNNLHQCKSKCYVSPCPPCYAKVPKTLKCEFQHVEKLFCHQNVDGVECNKPVDRILPCKHETLLACRINVKEYKCQEPVLKDLPCGHKKEMKCYENPSLKTCKQLKENRLALCGHSQTEECFRWKNPETIFCQTVVPKKLAYCVHQVEVKCCDKEKPLRCVELCKTRLPCGHPCDQICHGDQDPNHVTYICTKPCRRLCKNDHPCKSNHPCHQENLCLPCTEVRDVILHCKPNGHQKRLICSDFTTGNYKCEEPCEKTLPCKHKCDKLCHEICGPCKKPVKKWASCGHSQYVYCSQEPVKENCNEIVVPKNKSVCGHSSVKVPCKYENFSPEMLAQFCEHPCNYQFFQSGGTGCDHKCAGTCSKCLFGRIHIKCQDPCGRSLVCGHRCDEPCAMACPPCQKPCQMKCEHSNCTEKCGDPCSECVEECQWECPHAKCTKLCGQLCDRAACNEPCPKVIAKCGHNCVGFCGEPCPPLCRICDRKELEETALWSEERVETARFVFLPDCHPNGHTIEVTSLERWLKTSGCDSGKGPVEIGMKCCPLCKTPIRNCRRFGNLIRSNYLNVVAVKKRMLGNQETSNILRDQWIEKLTRSVEIAIMFISSFNGIKQLLYTQYTKDGQTYVKKKQIAQTSMESIDFICRCVEQVSKDLYIKKKELTENHLQTLTRMYQNVFDRMLSRHPLNQQEMLDFDSELTRLDYSKQLLLRGSMQRCNPANERIFATYKRAAEIMRSPLPLTDMRLENFKLLLENLDLQLNSGMGISDRERLEIIQAMDMLPGHWFKCPNGHIYAIGECGGAMELARCPECGSQIGGSNHRVVHGNQLAGEMDGATRPACSYVFEHY